MRTVRTLKTGLAKSRQRKVPCRTILIEDEIRRGIADEHGDLLSKEERNTIVRKEERRLKKHSLAITKARIKILRKKEATTLVQAVRRGDYQEKGEEPGSVPEKKPALSGRGFRAIDVSY